MNFGPAPQLTRAEMEARAFELQNEPPYDGSLHKCSKCQFFSRRDIFCGWARCLNKESSSYIETAPFANENEYCPKWRLHQ